MNDTIVTETPRVHVFAIIVLLAAVAALVFFIIMAIYAYNLMNLKPPSRTESTAVFWACIIFSVIFLAIVIYSLYKIFTHKSVQVSKVVTPTKSTINTNSTIPIKTNQVPIRLNNTPIQENIPAARTQLSDLAFTSPQQRIAIDNEVNSLVSTFSE